MFLLLLINSTIFYAEGFWNKALQCNFKINWVIFLIISAITNSAYSAQANMRDDQLTIDRIHLVAQQINLLNDRLIRSKEELALLQQKDDATSIPIVESINKSHIDKALLDISVAKSNLDSINIELTDSEQTITWLSKNVQEIQNQLNLLNMFNSKIVQDEVVNANELRQDLVYQQKLLALEKHRLKTLEQVHANISNVLQSRKDKYNHLNELFKSRKLLHMKQQQVRDELAYQELQNHWLTELNQLYARLNKLDVMKSKKEYVSIERDIYYANESANLAYIQSLIARYKDQIQQMNLVITKSNSISVLNEINDQFSTLAKQVAKLHSANKLRMNILHKHIVLLSQKRKNDAVFSSYLNRLSQIDNEYKSSYQDLITLSSSLIQFRKVLDTALQFELSSRQGLPNFSIKMMLDVGKEVLLLPALAFQVGKSLSTNLLQSFKNTSLLSWCLFAFAQSMFVFVYYFLRDFLQNLLSRPSSWREQINTKWLSLQWLKRNLVDLAVVGNAIGTLWFFHIPIQNYIFVIYLSLVWLVFKGILSILRICLVETTHDTTGHDMRLHTRLKWIIMLGGIVTGLTVFVHQLPLIYELSTLCDRLFLFFLMLTSLFLIRSWHVVPALILSHIDSPSAYYEKSIRLIGILIPVLLFGNSLIGLFGFLNLVMSVIWYEGIFLIVLFGYLVLRGLLSDAMQQVSQLLVRYVHNGWLWTEAFLKPIDKILRISLFLLAWASLFLLYGWDKQSPMVERLSRLLNYKIASVLNTSITPFSVIKLTIVISIFYWTAKWTREFVYRMLISRTTDMGIRNSLAILSQYSVVALGVVISLRVLGIDLSALVAVAGLFAFGIGLGLRDLANNFACGFLILLERPLRVGDIVNINGVEGEVSQIGSRAVRIKTWDYMDLMVPNTEIFNKPFMNWTARDNTVRCIIHIKIGRNDNPHQIETIIQSVLVAHKSILRDPAWEVYLKEMNDTLMDFEIRFFVNIREVKSRVGVMSEVLMSIWDNFSKYGIKTPHPQQEIFLRNGIGDLKNITALGFDG